MEQVRRGIMTMEEARHLRRRNTSSRARWARKTTAPPDLAEFPAEPGDILMLTTDGVLRHLEDRADP